MITNNTNDSKKLLNPLLDPCYTISRKAELESLTVWRNLKQALSHAKQNREWRRQHMSLYFREMDIRAEALKEGHLRGHAEGLEQGRLEMILSMIKNGADREFIKTVANLSDEELNDIISSQN